MYENLKQRKDFVHTFCIFFFLEGQFKGCPQMFGPTDVSTCLTGGCKGIFQQLSG